MIDHSVEALSADGIQVLGIQVIHKSRYVSC